MVGHLDVNVMGRDKFFACPAFLDNIDQFFGDIHTPTVSPSIFEPLCQLLAGVVIQYVHVQLALLGKSRERQIATSQVTDGWVDGIGTEKQV